MRHSLISLAISLICLPLALSANEMLAIPNWKMTQSMDSDQSGSISKKEFIGSAEVFKFIDKNKDGAITIHEVTRARKSTLAPPKVGDPAPSVSALDPKAEKVIKLYKRERPFALIFGTHT